MVEEGGKRKGMETCEAKRRLRKGNQKYSANTVHGGAVLYRVKNKREHSNGAVPETGGRATVQDPQGNQRHPNPNWVRGEAITSLNLQEAEGQPQGGIRNATYQGRAANAAVIGGKGGEHNAPGTSGGR